MFLSYFEVRMNKLWLSVVLGSFFSYSVLTEIYFIYGHVKVCISTLIKSVFKLSFSICKNAPWSSDTKKNKNYDIAFNMAKMLVNNKDPQVQLVNMIEAVHNKICAWKLDTTPVSMKRTVFETPNLELHGNDSAEVPNDFNRLLSWRPTPLLHSLWWSQFSESSSSSSVSSGISLSRHLYVKDHGFILQSLSSDQNIPSRCGGPWHQLTIDQIVD